MATSSGDAKDGTAFYGYLFAKAKPIPTPTPVLDALLRAIALHIVRRNMDGCTACFKGVYADWICR
jgi:hypothetical protein